MGHSKIAMTFDTYGHLMPGRLDETRAATDAYLAQLADGPRLRLAAWRIAVGGAVSPGTCAS